MTDIDIDRDPHRITASEIRDLILSMVSDPATGARGISPDAASRALVGSDEKRWRRLMAPIKEEARRLAGDGLVILTRKGRPIVPESVRGLYRIRRRGEGEPLPVRAAAGDDDDFAGLED